MWHLTCVFRLLVWMVLLNWFCDLIFQTDLSIIWSEWMFFRYVYDGFQCQTFFNSTNSTCNNLLTDIHFLCERIWSVCFLDNNHAINEQYVFDKTRREKYTEKERGEEEKPKRKRTNKSQTINFHLYSD